MRKTSLAFTILSTFVGVANAAAEGPYLGIKAGQSKNDHSCEATAIECDRSDTGYAIFGGYDFSQRLGLELAYTNIADSTAVYPEIHLEGELTVLDLSAKYSHRFIGRSRVFAKLGATYWQGEVKGWGVKVDGSGFSPTFGAGIAVPFGERFSARLEYQYFGKVGDSELGHTQPSFLSLGISWHFGQKSSDYAYSPYTTSFISIVQAAEEPPVAEEPAVAETSAAVEPTTTDIEPAENTPSPEPEKMPEAAEDALAVEVEEAGEDEIENASIPEEETSTGPVVIDDHSNSALFSKGSSVLKINYALEKIAVNLLRRPHLFVHIVVHTDDEGSSEQNLQLSKARAEKLADYLKWQGVSADRITVEGKGEASPIADNNKEVGRARSRRAEFFISETRTRR
jgi:Outer membrane protein and related peptidoglycan-associated (lipo)proteins